MQGCETNKYKKSYKSTKIINVNKRSISHFCKKLQFVSNFSYVDQGGQARSEFNLGSGKVLEKFPSFRSDIKIRKANF